MGKYFGTDGIRGIAGEFLSAPLAYLTGFAVATVVGGQRERPRAVIGKDTRVSSDMLEAALVSGLCTGGADVEIVGVAPTPAVAYLTKKENADIGIVISASHNSFEHNGIKIFNAEGFKFSDELEAEIERLIDNPEELTAKTHGQMGRHVGGRYGVGRYIEHLQKRIEGDYSELKIAFDCANGAASPTAERLFRKLGKKVKIINSHPNGININKSCGSTDLKQLRRAVLRDGFDVGFAFDGDADRCLVIDELGNTIDGDVLLAVLGGAMKKKRRLKKNTVVGTILSNSGLDEFAGRHNMTVLRADVGDRNVLELMKSSGANLGGEGSGHTIFLDDATTGDGQLTAIKCLNLLVSSGKTMSELVADFKKFPQVEVKVPVENSEKQRVMAMPELIEAINEAKARMGDSGSVLVRPSGTEAIIRVTIEAETEILARECAERLAGVVRKL